MSTDTQTSESVKADSRLSSEPLYSFEVSRALLQTMALFQSGDASRFILQSTHFVVSTNGMRSELLLVSTDGRRMAIHRDEILTDNLLTDLPELAEFQIDLCGVSKLPKSKGLKAKVLTCSVFAKHVELSTEKYKFKADFVQGQFPNWKSVIPAGAPSKIDRFSVSYDLLSDFGAAAKALKKESTGIELRPHVHEDGTLGAIEVTLLGYRQFFGVLAPLRTDPENNQSDWVKQFAEKPKAITAPNELPETPSVLGDDRGSAKQ